MLPNTLPSTVSSLRFRNRLDTGYRSQQLSPWQLNTLQDLNEPLRSPSYTRASSSDQSRANSDFLQNAPADFLGDQFSTAYNIITLATSVVATPLTGADLSMEEPKETGTNSLLATLATLV
jgi:hypothetical protein